MGEAYLVLGGNGFIGYSVICELLNQGKKVRCADYMLPENSFYHSEVEYCIGDIREKYFLMKIMEGIDIVMDFISTTMPNTNDVSVGNEISNTLIYHNYILSSMNECGIKKYVFPSSGGAVYGSIVNGLAAETDNLCPNTPYGFGKQMVEEMIKYYYRKCGISAYIFRIGNVYGSPKYRKKAQGIIDIFIQNVMEDKAIKIWGHAENAIRDYIFLEDVAQAIVSVTQKENNDVEIYNVGTGKGTSVKEIIGIISQEFGKEIAIEYHKDMSSGLSRIVLSTDKINRDANWKAKVSLKDGIKKTIDLKTKLI